jgi:hypothetical protein
MSERAPHESHEKFEVTPEQQRESQEKLKELIERAHEVKHEAAEKIDELRAEALESAKEREEVLAGFQKHEKEPMDMGLIRQDLKDIAYKRTLTRIRKDLPLPGRVLSRVVHNPVVDAVSEVGAKTVARPSGLLAGGICAFIGSSLFLWIAKHYGYEYNFLLFAIFFLGGFALGLVIELFYRLLRRLSHKN